MMRELVVTALLLTLVLGAPPFEDEHHTIPDEAEGDAAWSEEATTKLDLEDPASWSASTEVLDENHAWYRRRRAADDLEAAESVVFMPAHLRHRKKQAHEECRRRHQEFTAWRRQTANLHAPTRNRCNKYCCYPELHED